MARLGVSVYPFQGRFLGWGVGCPGCVPPPPPLRWPVAFWYHWYCVLKFIYVTSQLRNYLAGVSPPKKNPGSAPFFIISCNHLEHCFNLPFSISFVNENNQQTNVTLVKKFNDWRYDWRYSLEKRMPWLGARQSLLTTSTHSDYSDWGSIISEKKSSNPAPWIYGSMPSPGVIWYWINEDDCDASRNPGTWLAITSII